MMTAPDAAGDRFTIANSPVCFVPGCPAVEAAGHFDFAVGLIHITAPFCAGHAAAAADAQAIAARHTRSEGLAS